MNKYIIAAFMTLSLLSCEKNVYLNRIEAEQINVSDSILGDQTIEAYIKPYRENINKNLDSVLAYSVGTYSKSDGELNTAIGNMMADAIYEQANPIYKNRTGKDIDFVLLNHGGIRSIISKGNVTTRTAFELMPFENTIVVATLEGEQIKELLDYLSESKRAHPFSQLKIILDQDGNLNAANIKNRPIDYSKSYNVATNDYLYNGGNRMNFFKKNQGVENIDYKVRKALIDYFTKIDTLNLKRDDRFIQIN